MSFVYLNHSFQWQQAPTQRTGGHSPERAGYLHWKHAGQCRAGTDTRRNKIQSLWGTCTVCMYALCMKCLDMLGQTKQWSLDRCSVDFLVSSAENNNIHVYTLWTSNTHRLIHPRSTRILSKSTFTVTSLCYIKQQYNSVHMYLTHDHVYTYLSHT